MKKRFIILLLLIAALCAFFALPAAASDTTPDGADPIESVFDDGEGERTQAIGILEALMGDRAETVDIIVLLTILSLLPSILIMLTAFTRIIISLSFVRNAIGLQQMPPNQVMVGLALFLTFFVMNPVIERIKVDAYEPYIQEQIEVDEAIERAMVPIREYMLSNIYNEDLSLFMNYSNIEPVEEVAEIPTHIIIPAFIISEIKRAFLMGFFIYIPFIVIDMVVASTLMAMGMMMLPPATISLPFKVLLFVMVDGWALIVEVLLQTIKTFPGS